jgi:hypothetical protein
MRPILVATLALATLAATQVAGAPAASDQNDLRDIRLGMTVADLPKSGYHGFTCADMPKDAPGRTLQGWEDYRQCPAEPSGLRAVDFRYDKSPLAQVNSLYEGTKVGGHPVLLTLLIGDDAKVDGLVIETDPAARLYLRKKAFLFADQVKARYGDEGWTCTKGQPTADEVPVGGVFLKERCEKTTPTRHLILERELFRRAGQDLKDFVSRSRLQILEPSP